MGCAENPVSNPNKESEAMTFSGIVFDKDGTLFDFNATWGAWTAGMLADLGQGDQPLISSLADALGYDPEQQVFFPDSIVVAHTADEIADALIGVLEDVDHADLVATMDEMAANAPQVEATDLREFVAQLQRRDIKIGVATNDSEAPARTHLKEAGIEDAFDFIAGFDSGWGEKPEPGQLFGFCETLKLAPKTCAMVGDSLHDLKAGRAAGMFTIGVLTGVADHDTLAPWADLILPSIADLPGWLDQQSG